MFVTKGEMLDGLLWADVVWLEWGNETAVAASAYAEPLAHKRVICRIHSYEVFTHDIQSINWKIVNDLIFVAPHVRAAFDDAKPPIGLETSIHILPNGVDMAKFVIAPDKDTTGQNIAFLGELNWKKAPELALLAFAHIGLGTNRHLHIGGEFGEKRFEYYLKDMVVELGLVGQVHFHGRIDDVPGWFKDKTYLLTSSSWEGHPVGVIEAMACGVKPLVHQFYGSKAMFPPGLLWRTVYELKNKFRDSVKPQLYRDLVDEFGWTTEKQFAEVDRILEF
jgi:glycosyltransferase involved in cell wall biosynthesis